MIAQRVGVTAVRAAAKPSNFLFAQNAPKIALAARLPTTQYRPVTTSKISNDEGHEILAKQRLHRPIAPHLSVYKLNQTWFGHSAWTRITGCTLSGAAYVYFTSYLVAPLFGWHIESAALAEAFASMPAAVNGAIKFALGFPFAYHFINGIRHLVFDMGKGFAKPTIVKTEIATWAASVVGGLFLAFGL
ncbi:cytochrome b subunit of succinate dehydrogenase, Sdh3p [Amphichorda felina]